MNTPNQFGRVISNVLPVYHWLEGGPGESVPAKLQREGVAWLSTSGKLAARCIAVVLVAFNASAADVLTEKLQRGLFEEEANHDLPAAIQEYQSVVSQADEQRKVIATALFRLGECYRKLGKTNEATAQYQRLLRDFSEQEQLVRLAGDLVKPAPPTFGNQSPAATDEEEKEVRRIQAMIKDSPDLINARDNDGNTPLHRAVHRGQVAVARFLIGSKADVNARASDTGDAPLHAAAQLGHKSLVELLLDSGAEVNAASLKGGDTPLHRAAGKGFRSVIDVLLARKADIDARDLNGETPLFRAVGRGFKAIAELLLTQGADVNAKTSSDTTPLHLAARISNRDLVELLLGKGAAIDAFDNTTKFTALHGAVQNKNLPIVELLLAKKANPNLADQAGTTPLSRAVQDGAVSLLQPLLASGADPNLGDRNAITPLHWAAMLSGGEEVTELLLKHNASVTNRIAWGPGGRPPQRGGYPIPSGLTPLGLAIGYGRVRTAELLLDHGADVENQADYQNSGTGPALEVAISKNDRSMVKLLLDRKANPNLKNANGWTPLMQAAQLGAKEIVGLLLASGAEVNVLAPGGWYPLTVAVQNNKPEIAELLRQHGAIEDLARSSSITVARGTTRQTMFQKGTNDFNRHTLFEALAQHYAPGQSSFAFPDFARVQVRSMKSRAGEPGRTVDLETAFQFTNCAANTWLEWGDLVELPEQDHVMNVTWGGLASFSISTLKQCLRKQVSIIVKGQTNLVALTPELLESNLRFPGGRPARILSPNNPAGGIPGAAVATLAPPEESERPAQIELTWQRLNDVVRGANVIRSSSDLTRVKVIRSGQPEMIFDLVRVDKATDLWLRDGDVIEVPEKP